MGPRTSTALTCMYIIDAEIEPTVDLMRLQPGAYPVAEKYADSIVLARYNRVFQDLHTHPERCADIVAFLRNGMASNLGVRVSARLSLRRLESAVRVARGNPHPGIVSQYALYRQCVKFYGKSFFDMYNRTNNVVMFVRSADAPADVHMRVTTSLGQLNFLLWLHRDGRTIVALAACIPSNISTVRRRKSIAAGQHPLARDAQTTSDELILRRLYDILRA